MKTSAIIIVMLSIAFGINEKRVYAQETWEIIEGFKGEGIKKGGVLTLPALEDKSGYMWFVTNTGNIYRYDNRTLTLTMDLGCQNPLKQKKFGTEDCFKLFKDSRGDLWVTAKNKGISRYVNDDWQNVSEAARLASKDMLCSFEDSQGNIWFGTKKGVTKYDGQNWFNYSSANGFTDDKVTQITEDNQGNVWFNADNNELFMFVGNSWELLNVEELNLPKGKFRDIYCASDGKVWIVSEANICYYDGQQWTHFGNALDNVEVEEFKEAIGGTFYKLNQPILVQEDAFQNIWVAYKTGISRYDGNRWQSYTKADGLPKEWQLNWIVPDGDGNIYVGTFKNDAVLYKFNGTLWEELELKNEKYLSTIYVDEDNTIWAAGMRGVHKIEQGKSTSEVFEKPPMGYMYNGAYRSSDGVYWFGVQGFKARILKYTPPAK